LIDATLSCTGLITKDSVLKNPDFNRKFILQTDASQIGMGAVLQQEFEDGRHPVMFISKKFSGAEKSAPSSHLDSASATIFAFPAI
jgi:hypothetical protein